MVADVGIGIQAMTMTESRKNKHSDTADDDANGRVQTNGNGETTCKRRETTSSRLSSDVCVVGAGPGGLMLAVLLARFGINVEIIDERAGPTSAGRADGLQPKTIGTLRQLGLADPLLQRGAKIYDICFWEATQKTSMRRVGREAHYPARYVDLLDDYLLLVHQGMVEDVFIQDLRKRGIQVKRSHHFESLRRQPDEELGKGLLEIECSLGPNKDGKQTSLSQYVVGCDGARSKVRKCIPDAYSVGKTVQESIWGVLDGQLITDFPDLWSKSVIYNEEHGSILAVPRERDMTRFYTEIKAGREHVELSKLGPEFVMNRARQILSPYSVEWRSVQWFGNYQVRQRIANRFADPDLTTFIAGTYAFAQGGPGKYATHFILPSQSPHTPMGLIVDIFALEVNTSMHDTWNLAWKLNLTIRGLAQRNLLESYEEERRKIAHDLINFDFGHAMQIAKGDAMALADNFRTNIRFISGIGVEYDANVLNVVDPETTWRGELKPGCFPPPAKVTRYIDANPVDMQLDIPALGQFKVYLFVPDIYQSFEFLDMFCSELYKPGSLFAQLSRAAAKSYAEKPRIPAAEHVYSRPDRYTSVSHLMTFALITLTPKEDIEIAGLPSLFARSPWTFYLDNVPHLDTRKDSCTHKWAGDMNSHEVAIVNVRPDGYVGSLKSWSTLNGGGTMGINAAKWFNAYYGAFLQVPKNAGSPSRREPSA